LIGIVIKKYEIGGYEYFSEGIIIFLCLCQGLRDVRKMQGEDNTGIDVIESLDGQGINFVEIKYGVKRKYGRLAGDKFGLP
jgi:hypothetical protein